MPRSARLSSHEVKMPFKFTVYLSHGLSTDQIAPPLYFECRHSYPGRIDYECEQGKGNGKLNNLA